MNLDYLPEGEPICVFADSRHCAHDLMAGGGGSLEPASSPRSMMGWSVRQTALARALARADAVRAREMCQCFRGAPGGTGSMGTHPRGFGHLQAGGGAGGLDLAKKD